MDVGGGWVGGREEDRVGGGGGWAVRDRLYLSLEERQQCYVFNES